MTQNCISCGVPITGDRWICDECVGRASGRIVASAICDLDMAQTKTRSALKKLTMVKASPDDDRIDVYPGFDSIRPTPDTCKYCDPNNNYFDVRVDLFNLQYEENSLRLRPNVEFNFCPMCGREMKW